MCPTPASPTPAPRASHACSRCPSEFVSRSGLLRHESFTHALRAVSLGPPGQVYVEALPSLHPTAADGCGGGGGGATRDLGGGTCDVCGCMFRTARMLRLHVRLLHGDGKVRECTFCAKSFGHAADLNRHIAEAHGEDRKYEHCCGVCGGVGYPTSVQLRRHQLQVHGRSRRADVYGRLVAMDAVEGEPGRGAW